MKLEKVASSALRNHLLYLRTCCTEVASAHGSFPLVSSLGVSFGGRNFMAMLPWEPPAAPWLRVEVHMNLPLLSVLLGPPITAPPETPGVGDTGDTWCWGQLCCTLASGSVTRWLPCALQIHNPECAGAAAPAAGCSFHKEVTSFPIYKMRRALPAFAFIQICNLPKYLKYQKLYL